MFGLARMTALAGISLAAAGMTDSWSREVFRSYWGAPLALSVHRELTGGVSPYDE